MQSKMQPRHTLGYQFSKDALNKRVC